MRQSSFHGKDRTADERPDDRDPGGAEADALPSDPNPEHPAYYEAEAHRTYKRLKAGGWDGDDLGARKWGLLAYWYPWVLTDDGGDPA
jgi:hypothetical protein